MRINAWTDHQGKPSNILKDILLQTPKILLQIILLHTNNWQHLNMK